MVAVHTTTDEYPPLREHIELRRLQGLDTHDEWWQGVYRIVTGPSPEHGELLDRLAELLGPLVRAAGLRSAAPVNIGVDKQDCRVPDRAIYAADTPRTSPAFLASALLVVEVLSSGEAPREKLGFYQEHGVQEYLEIDLRAGTVELSAWTSAGWEQIAESEILTDLHTSHDRWIVTPGGDLDVKDYHL